MRGKHLRQHSTAAKIGITPADAGKTLKLHQQHIWDEDHPRGCGENAYQVGFALDAVGSPPRMRGKLTLTAAKTYTDTNHPRGCGENSASIFISARPRGSPPRMRGKPKVCIYIYMRRRERITPADAGKTEQIPDKRLLRKDHPRGCGENLITQARTRTNAGSPPRMRGKLYGVYFGSGGLRITPADAGKTHDVVSSSVS